MYKPIYPGTYYFNNFTFTTMGNSGHRGPTSDQTYADAPWPSSSYFSIKNGQQNWTVPANGTYQITAAGAYAATPGRVVTGQVTLSEGQVLTMLVGQQPTPLTANVLDNVTVGGGGGTFVLTNGTPLIVASGGDGSGPTSSPGSFLPSGSGTGGSGAGYYGNGAGTNPFFQFVVPYSYVNGGYGNNYEYGQVTIAEQGGFGGGQSPIGLLTPITQITGDGTNAVCTTAVPHGYPFNYVVTISGTTYYDGIQQIQVQSSNTFIFSTSNTQTVTSGTVSGLATGSSGGGGYTGSPGDGTSGATCYADPSVQNFTDLGPTSNASGYVTVSLVNPVPITQSPTWNQTWTDQPSTFPYETTWSACVYGNGTYVAVSNNGTYPVTYSTDGVNWLTQTYGSSVQPWVSVTFGNGIFVAVANNGSEMSSSDGIHWSVHNVPVSTATWESIAYGNGIFVAVCPYGPPFLMTSQDGLIWTIQTVPSSYWYGVTYANGLFVAVSPFSPYVMTSPDGVTWTTQTAPDGLWVYVTFQGGLFFATTYSGSPYMMSSADGISWNTATTIPASGSWMPPAYNNGTFVAVNQFGPPYVATSTDGDVWTQQTAPSGQWSGVAYGNGLFVAVGYAQTPAVMTSPDGINWTTYDGVNGAWNTVSYLNGLFVAVGVNAPMTSPDGINWTLQTAPVNDWTSITYGNGLFASSAHDNSNNGFIYLSNDAVNWYPAGGDSTPWTAITSGNTHTFSQITYNTQTPVTTGNGIFVATSTSGASYSLDGLNWTLASVVQPDSWSSVTYGPASSVTYLPAPSTFTFEQAFNDHSTGGGYDGQNTALSPNGSVLVIGGYNANGGSGNVYVYKNGYFSYSLQGYYAEQFGAGLALSFDGSVLAVGAPNANTQTGNVYVYKNGSLSYSLQGTDSSGYFGTTVALSSDGSVLAVGSYNSNDGSGNVYVYTNGTFSYSPYGPSSYFFGLGLSLSSNGSVLAVGAPGTNSSTGEVYVYTNGTLTYNIQNPYQVINSLFGLGVSLSSDGSILATSGAGNVYVYNTVSQTLNYTVSGGGSVSLSSDGSVVGTGTGVFNSQGAAYVYVNGTLSASFQGYDMTSGFGKSVSLSADGSIFAVGTDVVLPNSGSAYVYSTLPYTGPLFVAVANNGTTANVMYSIDGNVWSNATTGTTSNAWSAVTYGDGLFVATAQSNVMYSTNGQNWNAGTQLNFVSNCITYGNGYFAALSSNASVSQVAVTSNISNSWQYSTVQGASYTGVTYGSRGFVGVSPTKFTLGFTPQFWINPAQTSAANKLNFSEWNGLAYGNGTFVAVGNGLIQGTRDQGTTWNSYVSSNVACITYSQNLGTFVAVSNTYADGTYTSQDGLNWTQNTNLPRTSPSVAYGNGKFVAVVNGESNVLTSRDGVYWTLEEDATVAAPWNSIAYENGEFLASASDGTQMFSPDGVFWNSQTTLPMGYTTVGYGTPGGSGRFVALGNFKSAYSLDGVSWALNGGQYSFTIEPPGIFLPYPISVSGDGQKVLISSIDYSPKVFTNGELSEELSAPHANEGYGWASAMSLDGTIIAVGAPNANSNVGNVYVYSNGTLSYTLSGASANVLFGSSLALSGTGSVLAVGAPGTGYVNVYTNGTLTRTFVGQTVGDGFGWATALSSDGTVFAVSALNIGFGISGAQKVYYTKGATTYTLSGNSPNDGFGWAISLSGDGTVLAVSALFAGYVNVYNNGSFAYAIQDSYTNQFGWALSMNLDGSVLAVCAPVENNVYTYDGSGTLTNTYNGAGWQVAVSSTGGLIVSSTRYGTNINVYSQISPPAGTWYGVTYGNGIFVAVGYNVGMTSPDGIIWTTQPVPSAAWFSVIYGNGLFVAVGYGEGTTTNIMTSPDGINWTIQTSPGTNAIWNSVTYGNGIFVATSIYGPPYVITSPDGINWTTQTVPSQQLGPCTYGNGLFVICAYNPFGNYNVMTSPDGITWTPHVGISSRWRSVTYGNGVYVATGELPPVAMASHDGINWKAIYTIPFSFWDSIAYGNGRFVSVSNGQENFSTQNTYVTTSTDGFQFSFLLTGSPVYGNNIWVGISKGGVFGPATTFTYLVYSYDGRYWYVGSAPPDTWSAVSYGNGFFMAVTNNGTYPVAYSQDGINWSTETTGFQTTDWNSIVFGQNTFMALEAEGASTMITQVTETF